MAYTAKEIEHFNNLVKEVIRTGVIKKEDKKEIEKVLEYITGQKWQNRCVGCSMPQVSRILKAHHERLLKEELEKSFLNQENVTGTTITEKGIVHTVGDMVDGEFIPKSETLKIEKKRGRKPKANNKNDNDKPETI